MRAVSLAKSTPLTKSANRERCVFSRWKRERRRCGRDAVIVVVQIALVCTACQSPTPCSRLYLSPSASPAFFPPVGAFFSIAKRKSAHGVVYDSLLPVRVKRAVSKQKQALSVQFCIADAHRKAPFAAFEMIEIF